MHKDVTVSKLSRLQRQILVYARRAMVAKGQKIEPRDDVTVCIPAPPWLNDVLTKTLRRIFDVRTGFGPLGEIGNNREDCHPWVWFFEEIRFAEKVIRDAAKQACVNQHEVNLGLLYRLVVPQVMLVGRGVGCNYVIHPWPYHYGRGWFFQIDIKNQTPEEIMREFISNVGEDRVKQTGLWLDAEPYYPINCTIPELLRDLFGFPVLGPIGALKRIPII